MVKEYTEAQRRTPTASVTNTAIVKPRIDTSIGDAVSQLGQSLGSLENKQDAYDSERAIGAYKLEQARLLDEYSKSPTPTSAQTAKDQFRRLREKQQRSIRNDSGRLLFKDHVEAIDGLAFNALAENTFKKEKDIAIASLDNTTIDSLRLGTGKSIAEKEALNELNRNAIANNVRSGYMTVTEGERRIRDSRREFANQAVSEVPLDDVTDLLSNGGEVSTMEIIKKVGGDDGELLTKIAMIESGLNTEADNKTTKGLFQFEDDKVEDPFDPVKSTEAASKLLNSNRTELKKVLGRDATEGELLLAHQQGVSGTGYLLLEPNELAVNVLTEAYGSKAKAENAILKNGGSLDMKSSEFTGMWTELIANVEVKDTKSYMYENTGSIIDYATPSVRAARINQAQKERLTNLAQGKADAINALPVDERMKRVSSIKDVEMRSKVNKLVSEQITIENNITTAKEDAFEQQAIKASQGNLKDDDGNIISLPQFKAENAAEYDKFSKTKQNALDDTYEASLRNTGVDKVKSATNYNRYMTKLSQNQDLFLKMDWSEANRNLDTDSYGKLRNMFEEWKKGNTALYDDGKADTRRANSFVKSVGGIKPNKAKKDKILDIYYDSMKAKQIELKRELTTEDRDGVVKSLLEKIVLDDTFLYFDTETSTSKAELLLVNSVDDMEESYKNDAYVRLLDKGIKRPTDEQILEEYKLELRKGN